MDKDLITFQEAQLPFTQADLAKPTKEFVVNLITIFFNTFKIDGNAIKQPTFEQYDVLLLKDRELYDESIKLLNMYVAMSQIYEKIFMKDFQLLDILNPTSKKTQKWMKFLANFLLYNKNKLVEIEDRLKELEERQNMIHQYNLKTEEALEKIATSKKYRETQQAYNEELKKEIENLRKQLLKKKNTMEEQKKKMESLEIEKRKTIEIYSSKQAEAAKVTKATQELQAQVVESPEVLNAQLQELEKEKELKNEERETKYETIKQKSQLLEQKEQIQSIILKEMEKLTLVVKIFNEKRIVASQLEEIIKQKERVQEDISKLEENHKIEQSHCSPAEMKELNDQIELRLQPLRDQCKHLAKEAKRLEHELVEDQENHLDICSLIDVVSQECRTIEFETDEFLRQAQELYKKEMLNEASVQEKCDQFRSKKN